MDGLALSDHISMRAVNLAQVVPPRQAGTGCQGSVPHPGCVVRGHERFSKDMAAASPSSLRMPAVWSAMAETAAAEPQCSSLANAHRIWDRSRRLKALSRRATSAAAASQKRGTGFPSLAKAHSVFVRPCSGPKSSLTFGDHACILDWTSTRATA